MLLEEGKPILPVITKIFTYPIGTIINDVNVEYNVEEKMLTKKIQPSPKPAVLSSIEIQGASSEPTINQDVYQSTDVYPSDSLIISKNVGMMNGENVMILNVMVTPQYSPANDILYLPEDEIKIMVEYELPDVTYGATKNDDYKMVIITIAEFEDELQPLMTHKFNMGINTMIKTVEDIYNEYPDARDNVISEIVSLEAGGKQVEEATCGGLVGVGTLLDPSYSKADGLTGNIAGKTGMLPPTVTELTLETHVLERAVGTKELLKIERINVDETLLLHVGAAVNVGKVTLLKGNIVKLKLTRPICMQASARVAVSRKIAARWRLIGYGIVLEKPA